MLGTAQGTGNSNFTLLIKNMFLHSDWEFTFNSVNFEVLQIEGLSFIYDLFDFCNKFLVYKLGNGM